MNDKPFTLNDLPVEVVVRLMRDYKRVIIERDPNGRDYIMAGTRPDGVTDVLAGRIDTGELY